MGERREVEPLVAAAADAQPLWFGSGLSAIRLDAGRTGGRLAVHERLLPGGFRSPLHAHLEDDEVFYVVEGELTAHLDGADERASQGAVVLFPRGVPHAFRVESPTARVLAVNTPAGHERFFRALSVPAAEAALPPSPQRPDRRAWRPPRRTRASGSSARRPGRHDRRGSPAAGKG